MRKLVLVALLLLLAVPCLAQMADLQPLTINQAAVKQEAPAGLDIEIKDPNFSVAAVQALTHVKTGACLSYKLVRWKSANLFVDVGAVLDPAFDFSTIDGFAGMSTNIKPIDEWLENTFSLDTRWGVGWLFRADDPMFYMAADIHF